MLASSSVDRGFEPRSNKSKDYKISIWYFSVLARRTKEEEQRLDGAESV